VAILIKEYYPDVRSIIKNLQAGVVENKFIWVTTNTDWLTKLVDILIKPTKSSWIEMRQIIADAQVDDFQVAYRYLFDNLSKFSNGHDAEISVILDEYSYRANVCPDKELNFAAFTSKLLETIK
jgi:hypothetical protein